MGARRKKKPHSHTPHPTSNQKKKRTVNLCREFACKLSNNCINRISSFLLRTAEVQHTMQSNNAEDETQAQYQHDDRVDLESGRLVRVELCRGGRDSVSSTSKLTRNHTASSSNTTIMSPKNPHALTTTALYKGSPILPPPSEDIAQKATSSTTTPAQLPTSPSSLARPHVGIT